MIITRDGKQIELTENELRLAWEELEQRRVRSVVECVVDDNGYEFKNCRSNGYTTNRKFREGFINECIDRLQESIDDEFGAYNELVKDIVDSIAEDYDLEPEF